jgi:hypothetical protein
MRFAKVVKAAWVGSLGFLVFCSSGSSTVDGGSDAQNLVDTKPGKDVNGQDTSMEAATCGSGLTCEVCDGYTAITMSAPYAYPSLCASADIAAFITACGNNGNQTDCNNWQMNEQNSAANCLNCVYSSKSDPKWGVFACDSSGVCIYNAGGCIDLVTGTVSSEKQAQGSGSCGDLVDTDSDCQNFACGTCDSTDQNNCLTSATANECSGYDGPVQNATGACSLLDPDASNAALVNMCFGNTDPDFTTMVALMCGSPPSDGGTDAATD